MRINPIKIFQDNYVWCLHDDSNACVVDPGDAQPVIDYLNQNNLTLTDILITHHHPDHIGGVAKLVEKYKCNVYSNIRSLASILINENETIHIKSLNLDFKILSLPGHTLTHIAYYGNGVLFCGDTLFSCGCGYLFEGTYEQMYNSLLKIKNLAHNTLIFPTHEYTLNNIHFALEVEPNNTALLARYQECLTLREQNKPTLPVPLSTETATNPFLRCDQPELINQLHMNNTLPVEVFKFIREWKNNWVYKGK
jgi:hydroxyacylglutathione hydrolase